MKSVIYIQNAIDYIEYHLYEDISISDLAKEAFLSVFYFHRLFTKLTGLTVMEYIKKRRLSVALKKIRENASTIAETAYEVGYKNYEQFSRDFKEEFNIPPSELRKIMSGVKITPKINFTTIQPVIDDEENLIFDEVKIYINEKMIPEENMNKVCVIGLGYMGLPMAAILANKGIYVIGVDVNPVVVKTVNAGKSTFKEPGIDELIKSAVESGKLRAAYLPEEADAFIICVPTPINSDKTANMSYVESAAKSLVPVLKKSNLVVLESTSPPGTVKNMVCPILEKSGLVRGKDFMAVHSPERATPGNTLYELVNNNRILGGIDNESSQAAKELYGVFVKGQIFLTDDVTAETCKLMENTFRDVNIALANELALMCEKFGINIWEAINLVNMHPRVKYHTPGPGVGGHCVAVDPWFLVEAQPELAHMIRRSRLTNDHMPVHSAKIIEEMLAGIQGEKKVVIMGASFKPNVDDIRESPILHLIDMLEKKKDLIINVYEPHVNGLKYQVEDLLEAVRDADLLVLAVHHNCFGEIDWRALVSVMRTPLFFDTRNFLGEEEAKKHGFTGYRLLGSGKEIL